MNRGNGVNMAPVFGGGWKYIYHILKGLLRLNLLVPGKKYDTRKFRGETRDISPFFNVAFTTPVPGTSYVGRVP